MMAAIGFFYNIFPIRQGWAGAAREAASGGVTVLALGDSLTAGYGLAADEAVPAVLERLLRQEGLDVRLINAGVSGDTSGGGLARLEWALAENPDAAIVELGANDGLRGMSPERMEQNLDAILQTLAERGIEVLFTGMGAPPNMGEDYARRFNAVFPRLVEKHGVTFYPFYLEGVYMDPALNLPDGLHPNAAGARRVAENLLPHVRELVHRVLAARDGERR
jgi:acyl-CoA thioesterase I